MPREETEKELCDEKEGSVIKLRKLLSGKLFFNYFIKSSFWLYHGEVQLNFS